VSTETAICAGWPNETVPEAGVASNQFTPSVVIDDVWNVTAAELEVLSVTLCEADTPERAAAVKNTPEGTGLGNTCVDPGSSTIDTYCGEPNAFASVTRASAYRGVVTRVVPAIGVNVIDPRLVGVTGLLEAVNDSQSAPRTSVTTGLIDVPALPVFKICTVCGGAANSVSADTKRKPV